MASQEQQKSESGLLPIWAGVLCYRSFGVATFAAGIVSVVLVGFAFVEISLGVIKFYDHIFDIRLPGQNDESSHLPLLHILQGIEVILLAPLPFLIISIMAKFVKEWTEKSKVSENTHTQLEDFKILLYGLFLGLLTLNLISLLFSEKSWKLNGERAVIQLCAMGFMALVLLASEFLLFLKRKEQCIKDEK